MKSEHAFEHAILDDPADDSRRLVYADWLEERGDPRGEYLRAETELARTDPRDRRYRALRKRVAELRAQVDRRWGTTYGLRKIVAVEDLVYYLREFHRNWSDSPGLDPEAVPAGLPHGLTLIYRELGGLFAIEGERTPFAGQDALLPPGLLKRAWRMMEFACENSGNWTCRFPMDYKGEDPPVYSDAADVWQSPARGFQMVCDSLNHFLITLCLQEAAASAPCLVSTRGDHRLQEVLTVACRPLWLDGHYVEGGPTHSFFDVPGQDLLVMSYAGLWLGSHTDAALRLIRRGVKYNLLH